MIEPRTDGDFSAAIARLEPGTGATGEAELGTTHGYSETELYRWSNEAGEVLMNRDATAEQLSAAAELRDVLDRLNDSGGSFRTTNRQVQFYAPHNYSGGSMYYRITVTSSQNNSVLLTVDVSVTNEENPLPAAISRFEDAMRTSGTEEPGTEEPGTETPGTEEPATEQPGTEEPGTEEPGTGEPGTEQPGTETPASGEPSNDTPSNETPVSETPAGGEQGGENAP